MIIKLRNFYNYLLKNYTIFYSTFMFNIILLFFSNNNGFLLKVIHRR